MAKEEVYRKRITNYDWAKLRRLWKQIENGKTPRWDDGKAFEYLILRAFQIQKATVRWPFTVTQGELTRDGSKRPVEQIDGVVILNDLSCMFESKDKGDDLPIEPIAKLRSQLSRRPSQVVGVVFSSSGFTESALLLARHCSPQVILLWSGEEVSHALKKRAFARVFSVA